MPNVNVILFDGNRADNRALMSALLGAGHNVTSCSDVSALRGILSCPARRAKPPADLIIADYLPYGGAEVVQQAITGEHALRLLWIGALEHTPLTEGDVYVEGKTHTDGQLVVDPILAKVAAALARGVTRELRRNPAYD